MALAGGLIALILGIIGIIAWWPYFVKALAAGIPVVLLLGGALATYLGIEELKDRKLEFEQTVEFRSDADNFHLKFHRWLNVNGERYAEKTWDEAIPRDFQ